MSFAQHHSILLGQIPIIPKPTKTFRTLRIPLLKVPPFNAGGKLLENQTLIHWEQLPAPNKSGRDPGLCYQFQGKPRHLGIETIQIPSTPNLDLMLIGERSG